MGSTANLLDLQTFLIWDYSQIEIRLLAEVSGDPLLCKQFQERRDIHCLVGNALTGKSFEEIKRDRGLRTAIKGFHFALVYGVSKASMCSHMRGQGFKVTQRQTNTYYDKYFEQYAGVGRYMARQPGIAERNGFVESMFGFRRNIRKSDESRSTFWGNQAVNTPIQSSAHQLVLIAMALIRMKPKTYRLLQNIMLEVHDALYFRVRLRDLIKAYQVAKELLESGVLQYVEQHFGKQLKVPILAEAKAGFCLGSVVEYEGETLEVFLEKWRKKHREVEAKPLTSLLPELRRAS